PVRAAASPVRSGADGASRKQDSRRRKSTARSCRTVPGGAATMAFVMREFFRRWWPWLKFALFVAILLGVGWQFVRILQNEELQKPDRTRSPGEILWDETRGGDPVGMAASGVLYLLGLGFSAFFWLYVLRVVGEPVPVLPGVRGYYLSHLGKYVPGKGVALLMRTTAAAEAGAAPGAAALAAVYETLTFMAAGAVIAAVLVAWLVRDDPAILGRVLALLVLAGVPILPGVFNFLVRRLSAGFARVGAGLQTVPQQALMRDLTGRTLL